MHAGKHQEYEKRLHDALVNKTQQLNTNGTGQQQQQSQQTNENPSIQTAKTQPTVKSKELNNNNSSGEKNCNGSTGQKEGWPQLNCEKSPSTDKIEKKIGEVLGKDKGQQPNGKASKGKVKNIDGKVSTLNKEGGKGDRGSTEKLLQPTIKCKWWFMIFLCFSKGFSLLQKLLKSYEEKQNVCLYF